MRNLSLTASLIKTSFFETHSRLIVGQCGVTGVDIRQRYPPGHMTLAAIVAEQPK